MNEAPRRSPGVEINEVPDGYVIYDNGRDRVHYLNHTAAVVLEFCDGMTTEAEMVKLLQKAYELPEPPAIEVAECLELLRNEGLVA